ncbi:MAG: efflux RND transporter periplasmic adaptor subunit [Myxococcota bacterium]
MRMMIFSPVCVALVVSSFACSGEEKPTPPQHRKVRYIQVEQAGGARERTFSGVVEPAEESRLSFQVGGRIEALSVKMGDRVTAGQLIAKLDETDFRIALQEAQASLAQAQAEARRAEADYKRTSALYANKSTSVQELDSARADRDSSASQVRVARNTVESARRELGYATLKARTDGVIQEVAVEVNETVSSGAMIARVQAGEELEIAIDVPESYVNRIQTGQNAACVIKALGDDTLEGTISEIGSPESSGAAYPVRVAIDNAAKLKIETGMAANVRITFAARKVKEGVFRVPAVAVGEDREGRFVFVIDKTDDGKGSVRRVGVEVGSLESGTIEVEQGLSGGELVITAGVKRLYEGVVVLVPEAPEAVAL